jgi:hypothetical protein
MRSFVAPTVLGCFIGAWPLLGAAQTRPLNDTGLVICGNALNNNFTLCGAKDVSEPAGYTRQDGRVGRAVKDNAGLLTRGANEGASSLGFNFSKIQYNSPLAVLATGTALGTGTSWGCTRDNYSGSKIWDMKVTTASNARLNTNTYSWYNTSGTSNGGNSGTSGTASGTTCFSSNCDTQSFVTYMNTLNICGESADDWRLPTALELANIVDSARIGSGSAAVDATYFPNVQADLYWTSDNDASNPGSALAVSLSTGTITSMAKSEKLYVIIVRP